MEVKDWSDFKAEHLMFQLKSGDVEPEFRDRFKNKKKIIVIGMGGSVLPLGVFRSALGLEKTIELWSDLEFLVPSTKSEIENSVFCLVSKSGATLEVQAITAALLPRVPLDQFVVVSDEGTPLEVWARENQIPFCKIPKEMGGRFTNFTDFHRVLLESLGHPFEDWLETARRRVLALRKDPRPLEILFRQVFGSQKNHLILWAYGRRASGLAKWMQQALAESLGKINAEGQRKGVFPIVLEGPQDQHSVLQYLMDGPQDHVLWFIEAQNESKERLSGHSFFSLVEGQTLSRISGILSESTYKTFQERLSNPQTKQNLLRWKLSSSINDFIEAIVIIQAFVEYSGKCLGVNPYDQPGVERGKQIARDLLRTDYRSS